MQLIVCIWCAAQGVLKAMPLLKSLSITQGSLEHNAEVLLAVPLPSLHSLRISYINLCHARRLQGYTQLKELSSAIQTWKVWVQWLS
jgi:hypothetical protein